LKLCKIMVVTVLLYGCDNLTLLKCHERNTEIKLWRPVAGCTLYGHKTLEETREELNTYNRMKVLWVVVVNEHNNY